jgi:hypothetical protein
MYREFLSDLARIEELANMSDERCNTMEAVLPTSAIEAIRRIVAAGRVHYRYMPGPRGCTEEVFP